MQGSGIMGIEAERVEIRQLARPPRALISATRLLLIEAGSGTAEVAGVPLRLTRGDILCIPPATALSWKPETDALDLVQIRVRTRCLALQHPVDREALAILRRIWAWSRRDGPALHLGPSCQQRCAAIVRRMAEPASGDLLLKAAVLELLALLGQELPTDIHAAELGAPLVGIQAAIAHLERRIDQPFAIDEVCAIAGLRRSRFDQAFRQATGLPAAAWHRRLRLSRAAEMLRNPQADILSIALECGYSGLSRFYAAFTREFGVPPGRYRTKGAREGDGAR